MRYRPEHKQEAHARMVAAAGRGFRRRGFGGIGVDGLAKEAEVTSGAFYGHFPSKEAAFREAVVLVMAQLRDGVLASRAAHGPDWVEAFVDFYVGERRTCEAGESCALQSLSPEVARADASTRESFAEGLSEVVDVVAEGLDGGSLADRKRRAWGLLSVLSGGVTLARAVTDEATSKKIAKSIKEAALALARSG